MPITAGSSGSSELNSTLDGFDDLRDDLDHIEKNKKVQEYLTARLGPRSIRVIAPRNSLPVEPYTGEAPKDQQAFGKRILRTIGSIWGAFSWSSEANIKRVNRWDNIQVLPVEWDSEFEENKVNLFVSDSELVKDRCESGQVFYRGDDSGLLFLDDHPQVRDVAQIDDNSSCYLLSSLAAFAASPLGSRLLKNSIHRFDSDFVAVKFYDPVIEGDIKVLVSSKRLVNEDGYDVYSFDNRSGARWPGFFEKTYDAYMKKRKEELTEIKGELSEELHDHIDSFIGHLGWSEKHGKNLDYSDLSQAMKILPQMPDLKSSDKQFKQLPSKELASFDNKNLKIPTVKSRIRFNIEQGIPVIMGTIGGVKGSVNATSGTPTRHAMAVVGPATLMKGAKTVEGFLAYDPYGEALKGGGEIPDFAELYKEDAPVKKTELGDEWDDLTFEKEEVVSVKTAGQALRFYSYEDFDEVFERVVIARGGFDYDALPDQSDGTNSGEEPGWEMV